MIEERCDGCLFYLVDPENIGKQGFCRRYPRQGYPIPVPGVNPHEMKFTVMMMPAITPAYEWCGEWEPKEEEPPPEGSEDAKVKAALEKMP